MRFGCRLEDEEEAKLRINVEPNQYKGLRFVYFILIENGIDLPALGLMPIISLGLILTHHPYFLLLCLV